MATHYLRLSVVENDIKLVIVERPGCEPHMVISALMKMLVSDYNP